MVDLFTGNFDTLWIQQIRFLLILATRIWHTTKIIESIRQLGYSDFIYTIHARSISDSMHTFHGFCWGTGIFPRILLFFSGNIVHLIKMQPQCVINRAKSSNTNFMRLRFILNPVPSIAWQTISCGKPCGKQFDSNDACFGQFACNSIDCPQNVRVWHDACLFVAFMMKQSN